MRFSTILVGVFAAFATAQSSSVAALAATTPATATSSSYPQTSQQVAITKCLAACAAGDVDCQAKCITVPNPDAAQVNATTDCVAACPQGNGTAQENSNYATCVSDCISKYYYTTSGLPTGVATATGSAGSGAATIGASTTGTSTTGASTKTKTGTASEKTSSATGSSTAASSSATTTKTSAGESLRVATSIMGLVGFTAALFAL